MRTCTLIYFMGELGTRVFEFQSKHPDKDAHELMIKNPPGPTVRDVGLDDGYMRTIYLPRNPSYNGEIYRKAVEEKKWRESYFQRTGNHWHGEDQQTQSSERPPDADSNEKDSDEKNVSRD